MIRVEQSRLLGAALVLVLLLACGVEIAAAAGEYQFVTEWGTFGTGVLSGPRDIAFDGAGNAYILNVDEYIEGTFIFKAGPDGNLLARWSGRGTGAPQKARMASPSNLSRNPLWSITMSVILSR